MQSSSDASLNELCGIYWKPVYGFIRRSGFDPADAEDLTQSFFSKLLTDESLTRADEEKGMLRSFLLGAVKRHLVDFRRHRGAVKRGAEYEHLPVAVSELDFEEAEHQYAELPTDVLTPDKLFDQKWALDLLARAHRKVRGVYEKSGKGQEYELLKGAVATSGELDYAQAAKTLKVSPGHVRVLAHRLRKNFRAAAKDEIADTVSSLADVDEELADLLNVFS